jgi:ferredoxin--NADP+ reductase
MRVPGTEGEALRVAIVGSGPAGFYTMQSLLQAQDVDVEVDLFDRLPTPFGLVRHGVAPDHQKIKSVTAVYDRLARDPRCRFYGWVELGRDLTLADLERHYHQIVLATGAQSDRSLGIPGEGLRGSHSATAFVNWYNGHPDFCERTFELDCETAVVVGVGNVAVDVARILCRTPEELAATDIADHALEALRASRVREVHLLGRRGPAQAAFTNPEIKELGQLSGAVARTFPDEVELDPVSREALADRITARKVEILQSLAAPDPARRADKRLFIRFLVSPVALEDDGTGRVGAVRLARNELVPDGSGGLRARPTGEEQRLPAGLVFRSVGYHGVALADLPFDERQGVIPNDAGRVLDRPGGSPRPGLYVAGWIKRGPTGVIGTNKPDAAETVASMLADRAAGQHLRPAAPRREALEATLAERGSRFISYDEWCRLDEEEVRRGSSAGRPRVKLARHEELRDFFRKR